MNDSYLDLYLSEQYEGILRYRGKFEHGCDMLWQPWRWASHLPHLLNWQLQLLPTGCSLPTKGQSRNTKASPFLQDVGLLGACTFGGRTLTVLLKTLNCSVGEDFLLNHPPSPSPSHQSDLNWGPPTAPPSYPIVPHRCALPIHFLQACFSGEIELNR